MIYDSVPAGAAAISRLINYFDERLMFSVIRWSKYVKHLLVCCFSFRFTTANEKSLSFGLLVEPKTQTGDVTLTSNQSINYENNQQMN